MSGIDSTNDHFVGMRGDGRVTIALPPTAPMDRDEALRLAAWIVAIADASPTNSRFGEILAAVKAT